MSQRQLPQRRGPSRQAKARAANKNKQLIASTSGGMDLGKRTIASVASATSTRSTVPKSRAGRGNRRIYHAELVGNVSGATSFTTTKYPLNPGMEETFPWLSTQASGWEQYRFHSLKFIYVTRAATTKIGSVMLIPEYDPTDPLPTTEEIASAYEGCIEDASWKNIVCVLSPPAMHGNLARKFIRDCEVPNSLKNYDAGQFIMAVTQQDNTDAIGKLWVEYDVEFFVPQRIAATPAGRGHAFFDIHTGAQTLVTATPTNIAWETVSNALNITYSATNFVLAKGAWLLRGEITVSDTNAELLTSLIRIFYDGATIPYWAQSVENEFTMTAAGSVVMPFTFYVVSDGAKYTNFKCTLTGAAGTLTLVQYMCHLAICVA